MKSVLSIGLVNNMPDAALEATERQFQTLLNEAADNDITVRLNFYSLPGVPRKEAGRQHVSSYHDIGELWDQSLDGLIVTGAEPRTKNLRDEPFWGDLTQLLDWAAQNTASAVWSCLAAHAAVLHLDGIQRCRRSEKRFGVFECLELEKHFLMAGGVGRRQVPHSRWNDLREEDLRAAGYHVLTRIESGGVDAFLKQGKSLFLFLQGHPEYDTDTLLREYRRDIRRFLMGESEILPSLPHGYSDCLEGVENSWHANAVRLYRNWLSFLAEQKGHALQPLPVYA